MQFHSSQTLYVVFVSLLGTMHSSSEQYQSELPHTNLESTIETVFELRKVSAYILCLNGLSAISFSNFTGYALIKATINTIESSIKGIIAFKSNLDCFNLSPFL